RQVFRGGCKNDKKSAQKRRNRGTSKKILMLSSEMLFNIISLDRFVKFSEVGVKMTKSQPKNVGTAEPRRRY
ncbi:MAG: hypothetical protein ACKO96_04520, partial [Flammeovirgaceae bacterium]